MDKELPKAQYAVSKNHTAYIESLQHNILRSEVDGRNALALRAYGVSVLGFNFLIKQGLYCELLTDIKISPLPNAPDHFFGLTNVRGNLVPVYQMECLIDGPNAVVNPKMALLFDLPSEGAALAISDKPRSLNIAEMEELGCDRAELPELLRPVLVNTYSRKSIKWHQIDHQALFTYLAQLR